MTDNSGEPTTWSEAVHDVVRIFEVAAATNCDAVFNAKGSAALAGLLKHMAEKLDSVVEGANR